MGGAYRGPCSCYILCVDQELHSELDSENRTCLHAAACGG